MKSNNFVNLYLLISIIITSVILSYVYKIKQSCIACIDINEIIAIESILLCHILYAFATFFYPTNMNDTRLTAFMLILNSICFILLLRLYQSLVENENCDKCSKDWRRTFLYFELFIEKIIYTIIAILFLISVYCCRYKIRVSMP